MDNEILILKTLQSWELIFSNTIHIAEIQQRDDIVADNTRSLAYRLYSFKFVFFFFTALTEKNIVKKCVLYSSPKLSQLSAAALINSLTAFYINAYQHEHH